MPANFALHHEHHCPLDEAAEVDAPLFTSIRIGVAGCGLTRLRFGLGLHHFALRFALLRTLLDVIIFLLPRRSRGEVH